MVHDHQRHVPNTNNDATAQTLNYALGNLGGRQKSWMVPPPATVSPPVAPADMARTPLPFAVRGRGRPRKQPVLAEPTRPTIEQPAEPQTSSNSTSPQLANAVASPNRPSYGAPDATVFPSPAPSEENVGTVVAAPTGAVLDTRRETPGDVAFDPAHANYAPETSPETVSMDSTRRATSLAKRPIDGQTHQADKRGRVDIDGYGQSRSASTTGVPSPTVAGPHYPEFPRRRSAQRSHNGSPMLEHMQIRSPSLGNYHLPQGRTPPQSQSYPRPPSRPSSRGITQQVPTSQYANTPLPAWYTQEECMRVFQAFEASYGSLSHAHRDGGRLTVLKEAIERQDWPYLTMHQYYCLLTLAPETLPHGLRYQPNLLDALKVMEAVLASNTLLSPAVLEFFSIYPYSVEHIAATWPFHWNHQAGMFSTFVARSPNYDLLAQSCERRGYPPLAGELLIELGVASTTFQRLIFTAILRRVFKVFPTPQNTAGARVEAQAVAIFEQNQAELYRRRAVVQFPDSQQERELEIRVWSYQLMEVLQSYRNASLVNHQQQQQLHHHHHHRQQYNSLTSPMLPRPSQPSHPHSAQTALSSMQQPRGRGRPPAMPPQQQRKPRAFFPTRNDQSIPQQREPNPARFSLHQAHLRSPVLRASKVSSPLYTFTDGFLKQPTRISQSGRAFEKWVFEVPQDVMQRIPQTVPIANGDPGNRLVDETNKTFRLRCIKSAAAKIPSEHEWAVLDTSWIPYSYLNLNGTALQQRKKVYNGKDLPVDITELLKEGENVLEVAVVTKSDDASHLDYLIAIETVAVLSQQSIKQLCLENRIPADEVLQSIKNRMSGSVDDADEISIVESSLTIGLFDPFAQASICNIPVRGRACPHNDCFDLDTFLVTRSRKGDASVPDQWKCPICKADARPHMLIVDGFLEDVKEKLESKGLARTRQIIVQQDGTWKPKAEVREGISDRASDEPLTPVMAPKSMSAPAEVIDLSD